MPWIMTLTSEQGFISDINVQMVPVVTWHFCLKLVSLCRCCLAQLGFDLVFSLTGQVNEMLRKLSAIVMIVLGALPFTAPFSTFDLSHRSNPSANHHTTAGSFTVAFIREGDDAGSIVPTLLTRSGRLRIDASPQMAHVDRVIVDSALCVSIAARLSDASGPPGQSRLRVIPLPLHPLPLRL